MLKGKTIVITGAASGLGEAWANGFIGDGATVIAADVNQEGLDRVAKRGAIPLLTDVSNEDDVATLFDFTISQTGQIDALFNNAGIGINRSFLDVKHDEFERHLAVHLFGAVYGMRYVLPHMLQRGYGRIINTISWAAEVCAAKNAAYASAKAALWAASRSVANELQDVDILVNMLIPGPTNTAIWGRDMPHMQSPEVTYPTAKMLATLPKEGPRGKVFWNEQPYDLFAGIQNEHS